MGEEALAGLLECPDCGHRQYGDICFGVGGSVDSKDANRIREDATIRGCAACYGRALKIIVGELPRLKKVA